MAARLHRKSAIPKGKILPAAFYGRDTVRVARELLGLFLVRKVGRRVISGMIVETEAYTGPGDPASHAFAGPTPRSRIMFGPPGRAYVYLCYGFYCLLNVVTEKEGTAGAVLIRALSPDRGLKWMLANRKKQSLRGLTDGPGKLSQALEIDLSLNGWDLTRGDKLHLIGGDKPPAGTIEESPRVGIKVGRERLWRFRLKINIYHEATKDTKKT